MIREDVQGELVLLKLPAPQMHPPKPKPSTQVVTQGTKVPTEGRPGVVSPSQALLLPRGLRPHCVHLETPKREGGRLVPWAHTCQLERWHHLLDPAEGRGRRRRCSPYEVLSLPPNSTVTCSWKTRARPCCHSAFTYTV